MQSICHNIGCILCHVFEFGCRQATCACSFYSLTCPFFIALSRLIYSLLEFNCFYYFFILIVNVLVTGLLYILYGTNVFFSLSDSFSVAMTFDHKRRLFILQEAFVLYLRSRINLFWVTYRFDSTSY